MPSKLSLIVPFAVVAALCSEVSADDEGSEQTVRVVAAPGAGVNVDVGFDSKSSSWHFTWQVKRAAAKARRLSLPNVKQHAHLDILVPKNGRQFVVVDSSASHHHDGRILIVSRSGKVLKKFGFGDFLTAAEIKSLDLSVSHTWWVKSKKPYSWDKSGRRVTLLTKQPNGRKQTALVIDPAKLTVTRR